MKTMLAIVTTSFLVSGCVPALHRCEDTRCHFGKEGFAPASVAGPAGSPAAPSSGQSSQPTGNSAAPPDSNVSQPDNPSDNSPPDNATGKTNRSGGGDGTNPGGHGNANGFDNPGKGHGVGGKP